MLGGDTWSEKDARLTLAHAIYQDGLCGCGKPVIVAHSEENKGWYETKSSICHACAASESAMKGKDGKRRDAEPGRSPTWYWTPRVEASVPPSVGLGDDLVDVTFQTLRHRVAVSLCGAGVRVALECSGRSSHFARKARRDVVRLTLV